MKCPYLQPLSLLVALQVASLEGQSYTCRSGSDSAAIQRREYIVKLVTAMDSATVARRTLYNLPSTTANKVTVVGSGSICNRAGAAYHAVVKPGVPAISRTVTVVKIGTTRFVVDDPSELFGQYSSKLVFDNNWVKLSGWSN